MERDLIYLQFNVFFPNEITIRIKRCIFLIDEGLQHLYALKRYCAQLGAVDHIYNLEEELLAARLATVKQQTITKFFKPTVNADRPCCSHSLAAESTKPKSSSPTDSAKELDVSRDFDTEVLPISDENLIIEHLSPKQLSSLNCIVCKKDCDGAHTCAVCMNAVHAICGESLSEDDEGYGRPMRCWLCLQSNKTYSLS